MGELSPRGYAFDAEDQGRKCLRLWMAVVASSISDACLPPVGFSASSLRAKRMMDMNPVIAKSKHIPREDSMSALYFLFEEGRADNVLLVLDISPKHFRDNLVACMHGEMYGRGVTTFTSVISEAQRRAFRFNYKWWLANQKLTQTYMTNYGNNRDEDHER